MVGESNLFVRRYYLFRANLAGRSGFSGIDKENRFRLCDVFRQIKGELRCSQYPYSAVSAIEVVKSVGCVNTQGVIATQGVAVSEDEHVEH